MNTRNQLIAVAVAALISGSGLAASKMMTEKQITDAALNTQAGTVEHAKLEKKAGKDVWQVAIKDKTGKEHTLFFKPETGKQMKYDASGKEIRG
jgi:uncharacterized membrane protein YkoI